MKEAQRLAKERALNAEKSRQEVEERRLEAERERRLKIEHDHDAAQAKIERDKAQQAEVDRQLAELEHTQELVRKGLADAAVPKVADVVPVHPLQKFLQHTPD
jgi:hypothetical protein